MHVRSCNSGTYGYDVAMSDAVTPSQMRQDIYRLIDRVLETGEPLVIKRRDRTLRLIPDDLPPDRRLARIRTNPNLVVGDPNDLVSPDWSDIWQPDESL